MSDIKGKFIDLLDRGEFGPRSSLGADKLLQNLVAYMLGKAADSPREPSLPFPPGATRYHGVRWQIRELPVHQCCQGGLDASEHVI